LRNHAAGEQCPGIPLLGAGVAGRVGFTTEQGDIMAGQESEEYRAKARRSEDEEPADAASAAATERKEQLDEDVDALLDEIDDVLEENAEEFVRGFVQKGGQ
jgi:ubiquitin-like protein Pup